jgi:hypothetical protein
MPPTASAPHRHYLASVAAAGAAVLTAGLIAAPAAQASDTVPWTGDSAKGVN